MEPPQSPWPGGSWQWSGEGVCCGSSWLLATAAAGSLHGGSVGPAPHGNSQGKNGPMSALDLCCPFRSLLSTHSDLNLNQLKLTLGEDSLLFQVLRAHVATTLDRADSVPTITGSSWSALGTQWLARYPFPCGQALQL